MLFRRNDPEGTHRRLAITRDLVEIVAIVLAGIWAIYVFVYTDRIAPFTKPVAPEVDASMAIEGVKGDLLAVRISQSIKNLGPAPLRVMGRAANVSGDSVQIPDSRALREGGQRQRPLQEVKRRYSLAHFETAFTYIDRQSFYLESGQTFGYSSIIYVPRNRYDALVLDSSFAYTRRSDVRPVTVGRNDLGIPTLSGRDIDVSGTEIQTSLWH